VARVVAVVGEWSGLASRDIDVHSAGEARDPGRSSQIVGPGRL